MPPEPEAPLLVRVEKDGRSLQARVCRLGADLVVAVGGGERPHVGCVVLAVPRHSTADPARRSVTVSLLTLPPHKEESIARPIAERLARACGAVTVVSAGVHDDGLDAVGAAAYLVLAGELADALVAEIGRPTVP